MTYGTHLEMFTKHKSNCSEIEKNRIVSFLFKKYSALIHRTAWRCTSLSHDQAYGAAVKGFMEGINNFDPTMGVDFAYRVSQYMRSAIQKEYRDERTIHIPHNRLREYEQAFRKNVFSKPEDELTQSEKDLIESLADILPILQCPNLETPIGDDGQTLGDLKEQGTFTNPDEDYYMKQVNESLKRLLNLLPEDEKLALIHFNGLFGEEGKNAREVGSIIGRSHQGAINARIRGEKNLRELCLENIEDVGNAFDLGVFQ